MSKMKNVAKNEIFLQNPYSNALWRGGGTMGENHSFWLLKRFLIFQGISGDLDANLFKHITQKIQ